MRCWYVRWQLSSALDRGDLATRLQQGHAAGCAACQAFGRSLRSLHDQLARGARDAPAPVAAARPRRWPLLIAGTTALGAATALVLALGPRSEPPLAEVAPPVQVPRVADRISQALAHTPLDGELHALIADGKRGLDEVLATGGLRRRQ
jgi:hypothetical protein